MERTLVLIKPDGVARALIGTIIHRFEQRGFEITALKLMQLSHEQAELHYHEHIGKPFFDHLIQFITSGPLIAMIVQGDHAIKLVRAMIGATNPVDAQAGTIRGDFATVMAHNVVHGSDGVASAEREIKIFFKQDEIFG
ncbi:nucleoside diphosphate kinase [Sporomusaceae bacterium FL31]|nr:nucleoside diphosphate kinase [Sporomusaceae bacterium FL31]GCE33385.1 nucleoside diphosphate kinase [Sporomusaceae bacterium]